MQLTMQGILLKRIQLKEYDEKLIFFTDKMGKVMLFSYGSKSPRSRRRMALTMPALLKITYEKKGNHLTLKELERIKLIGERNEGNKKTLAGAQMSPANTIGDGKVSDGEIRFQKFLRLIRDFLPFEAIDDDLFAVVKSLIFQNVASYPGAFLDLILPALLLTQQGILPRLSHCCLCQKTCSEIYFVLQDGNLIGETCHEKHTRKHTRKHTKQLPDKTIIDLSHFGIAKNAKFVFSINLEVIALLNAVGSYNAKNISIHQLHENYQLHFVSKNKKDTWDKAYKLCAYLIKIA